MSLNLGNDGIGAIRELKLHPKWDALRKALAEQANKRANDALDMPADAQQGACGYARALRDLCVAFEAATDNTHQTQVKKPGPVKE